MTTSQVENLIAIGALVLAVISLWRSMVVEKRQEELRKEMNKKDLLLKLRYHDSGQVITLMIANDGFRPVIVQDMGVELYIRDERGTVRTIQMLPNKKMLIQSREVLRLPCLFRIGDSIVLEADPKISRDWGNEGTGARAWAIDVGGQVFETNEIERTNEPARPAMTSISSV